MKPLILQLAKDQVPLRHPEEPLLYDSTRQLSVLASDREGPPAVLHPRVQVLMTKKGDREKGEDDKDR